MVLNQADNVRQKFLILRFCFDWFKNRQRFQLLFHLCRRNLFFLYGDDRDIQANGSSFSFVRGDSVNVTAMKFRISLDQLKSDTRTFLIAGMWRLEKALEDIWNNFFPDSASCISKTEIQQSRISPESSISFMHKVNSCLIIRSKKCRCYIKILFIIYFIPFLT